MENQDPKKKETYELVDEFLSIIDFSIKKLATPTVFIVAATILSHGLSKPDTNHLLINILFSLFILFAGCYGVLTTGIILKKIDKLLSIRNRKKSQMLAYGLFIVCYFLMYLTLAVIAAVIAQGKIPISII